MLRILFGILLLIHSLIHLAGFARAFGMGAFAPLRSSVSRSEGVAWLMTGLLLLLALSLFWSGREYWWVTGVIALVVSQYLIVRHWPDARYGTIINLVFLLVLVTAVAGSLPGSYRNRYRSEARKGVARLQALPPLTEEDIRHLPPPVQKYLRYTGSVGQSRIQNFHATYEGEMSMEMGGPYRKVQAEQYNFYDRPARVFYIRSQMWGIPFDGLHLYAGPAATMQIKIASLLQVVNARGSKMNRSETVTLFADMCFMAPAALIDKNIQWEPVNDQEVKARYTNAGHTIQAILYFNDTGELVNFSSDDRYMSSDGKTYVSYRWTTPTRDYREIGGRRVGTYAEAVWHTPKGEYCYGKFRLTNIRYNCRDLEE